MLAGDDDDMVLGGSDITMGTSDSGIMLVDPADSRFVTRSTVANDWQQ